MDMDRTVKENADQGRSQKATSKKKVIFLFSGQARTSPFSIKKNNN